MTLGSSKTKRNQNLKGLRLTNDDKKSEEN